MIEGKTKTGFAYKIEDANLNNMELVDAIAEADGNPIAVSKVVLLLLGAEQRKALYDHLRAENGTVPVGAVKDAILDIFQNSGSTVKN